jgi:hypothetical protein
MSTVEEIEVKALVSAYEKVWHGMMVCNTEDEFTEAKRRLFEWYDVIGAVDSETRKQVFARTK